MNIKQVASDIVLAMQDERWQKQEARILAALEQAYRVGFLDGEASVKPTFKDQSGEFLANEIEGACV